MGVTKRGVPRGTGTPAPRMGEVHGPTSLDAVGPVHGPQPRRTNQQEDPESFVPNYLHWEDPRLDTAVGGRVGLDARLAKRGMNVTNALATTYDKAGIAAAKPTNLDTTRAKNELAMRNVDRIQEVPGVGNHPTGTEDITDRYESTFGQATARGIASAAIPQAERPDWDTGAIPGTGWYFAHRGHQSAQVDPGADLSSRQVTAMGAKMSSLKTPEDEAAGIGGISRLSGPMANRMLNGRRISSHSSEELAAHAVNAAAWSTHEADLAAGTKKTKRPNTPKPQATAEVYDALRNAGRAHEPNVLKATQIARAEITPQQGFGESTPKTGVYGEMQAQSNPRTLEETDQANISAHHRDTQAGLQSRDQGMMIFSQKEPGRRAYPLRSDAPTAIDTWMMAVGSGQPMRGGGLSPAKRMVDKGWPLDPSAPHKARDLGIPEGDPSVTSEAVISAQHNEALRRVSEERIGPISHDQFGQPIHIPTGTLQETIWTEGRRQAGEDPEFSAHERTLAGVQKKADRKHAATLRANKPLTLF
jgi:hypothetical protein